MGARDSHMVIQWYVFSLPAQHVIYIKIKFVICNIIGATMYTLYLELETFIRLRHEYLTTNEHRQSPRATTILVVGIPNEMNNFETLKKLFDVFPGGVRRIWLNREPSKLANFTAKREKLVDELESATTTYIKQHAKDLAKSQS